MQLQNFSVNDGEGIRTNIFMAGCPMRCAWCSNPEGQTQHNVMTHWAETEEVLEAIRHQAIFYRFSGGGVTFSGGEATAQPAFLKELADALYDDGISLALETCGYFDFKQLRPTLEKMDLIFVDLKQADDEKHRHFTGVSNRLVLENIRKMAEAKLPITVRIPTIVGVNASEADMKRAFAFLKTNAPGTAIEFLPYHRYGEGKYTQLGLTPPGDEFAAPSTEELSACKKLACTFGLQVVSYT